MKKRRKLVVGSGPSEVVPPMDRRARYRRAFGPTDPGRDRAQGHAFPTPGHLASWAGVCPGRHESAGVSTSNRCPKGNRNLRRVLTESALAAIKTKGSIFQSLYRRWVARLGHPRALWAVAHRLCRLIWRILHEGLAYEERSGCPNTRVVQQRAKRLLRQLNSTGLHGSGVVYIDPSGSVFSR